MNLKLEELRKRLLDPTASAPPAAAATVPETIYKRSAEGASPLEPDAPTIGADSPRSTQLREASSSPQADTVASTVLQYVGDAADATGPKSRYQLAQSVTKVFESTRMYQERLAELAKSFDQIEQMAQAATRAFEPIRAFRDQMEKLSKTFEPMRSFQEQLGTLAESFEPMKALHEQMVQLAEAFQVNLAQFARSLEPAKAFQGQIMNLAKTFEAVGELQGQFLELSESFRVVSRGNGSNGAAARN